MVVKPFTPDESVSNSGRASRSRTSPTIATSGAIRRNPDTNRRRSTAGRSSRAGRVCIDATLGNGTSASNTSSAITTRNEGSSSAAQHDSIVVLPAPGAPANDDRLPRLHAGRAEIGSLCSEHVALHELVERSVRHAGELSDVDDHVAVTAHIAVDDVQPGAIVELRVLEPLGGVELPVERVGVVEDLRQRADDVFVVVEDLGVVAGIPDVR